MATTEAKIPPGKAGKAKASLTHAAHCLFFSQVEFSCSCVSQAMAGGLRTGGHGRVPDVSS